ncbi:unnamed protein product [Mytilus coruscus]|uniref:Uncharacterized protein n=1 Tax=Mytilus coruscus TaxID=42192 RepID=A0A6J8DF27_MYTCO|nr:unnamed protein product [Mytilus coruscus]
MRKHRAIKKLQKSLPDSPGTRISTLAAYLRNEKSPTIKTLQSSNIIYSPEENIENQLGLAVLEDMKIAISETKLKRTDQARLSMNVLSASVSGNCVKQLRSKLSLAKKLGVPARRISSGFTLRNKISKTISSSQVYTKRKVRTDALSDANKNLIHDFWCSPENSHPTGNKNDVKRVRIGPKKYSSHHVQILEKTQSEVFIDFKNKYPSVKVCQSLFERCKPYFVRAASTKDRVTCCCRYHLEIKYVFKAAMNNRKKCYQNLPSDTQFPVYASVTDMCNATLCNPNENGFHDKKCLDRNCPNCGVKLLNFSNEELKTDDSSENINWECFEYINQNTKHGPKKKLMLVQKKHKTWLNGSVPQKLLGTFPAHNFRAKWQNNQLKHLVYKFTAKSRYICS